METTREDGEISYLTRSETSAMNADMTDSGTSTGLADSSTTSPALPFDGSIFDVADVREETGEFSVAS